MALQAVRWAAAAAAARRAPLRLVVAVQPPAEIIYAPWPNWGHAQDVAAEWAEHALHSAQAVVSAVAPTVEVASSKEFGRPAVVLVEHAHHAAMVVVGRHGMSGLPDLLGGALAVRLAAAAACPVVVVPEEADVTANGTAGPIVVGVDGTELSEAAIAFAFGQADRERVALWAVHGRKDRFSRPTTYR